MSGVYQSYIRKTLPLIERPFAALRGAVCLSGPTLVLVLLLAVLPLVEAAADPLPGPIPARLVSVHDGDSIKVRARIWIGQEVETNVRIAGVDAPELRGKCDHEKTLARAARRFVQQRLGDGPVWLYHVQNGKFAGRVVARVRSDAGEDLTDALVAAGHARPYAGGRRAGWCSAERG